MPIPFGISTAFYYIIYFNAGYEALIYADKLKKFSTLKSIVVQWIIFIIAFVLLTIVNESWTRSHSDNSIIVKLIGIVSTNFITKVYGFLGVLALYSTSISYTSNHKLSSISIKIGTYCFGVYLFQQFLLQGLYYHTELPMHLSSDLLPCVSFPVTLMLSIGLSVMLKNTKIGERLI